MTAAGFAGKGLGLTRNDEDDLFDAVLTGSVDKVKILPSKQSKREEDITEDNNEANTTSDTSNVDKPSETLVIYIGKFPWWITEEDVTILLNKLGVLDISEIKFAENKVNGLSKGYVEVVVSSEASVHLLMNKIATCKLGGENITCHYADDINLSMFEHIRNESYPPCANMNESDSSFLSQNSYELTAPQQVLNQYENTFPSIPNPFLSYPCFPSPHLPSMFLNFMTSTPNLQAHVEHSDSAKAGTSQEGLSSSITDKDFEDLLNRNRAVASAAINKAVTGATTGDMEVAMETLLTAISIIKQSRVYQDDRCQALVTSLKDCLMSIQGSYRHSRHSEEGERDRRKSSSSERRRSSHEHRDQSRSRVRSGHFNEHSREWDRHRYRDNYRERQRDRNRDRYY